jgi:glycosyltransferase involved in cell wall biosynthesis
MPQVSVIIPLYNKARYIRACVHSVLQQTFTDFELIIVDDGSTDDSVSLISDITDSRLRLVAQKNAGPGAARNKGLALANGAYVSFLDADDTWHTDFLQTALQRLYENPDCDLFLCGSIWQPGSYIRLPVLKEEADPVSGRWKLPQGLSGVQAHDVMNFFALGTMLLKRHVPGLYGGFFDRVKCTSGEDSYLWIQVMVNHTLYRELTGYVEINTEGSDLGIGRGETKPVPPALVYSDQLFRNSPAQYRFLLSKLLDYTAFQAIRRELYKLNLYEAWKLYRKFPGLEEYRSADFPEFPNAFFTIPLRKILKRVKAIFVK